MSALDEFPSVPHGTHADGTVMTRIITCVTYEAMCDRIDTLTAERLWLKGELTVAELSRWRTLRQTILLLERAETAEAELRSLRQAVARWKRLRFLLGHLVDADNELIALVPSDNSWETELAEGYTPSNPHTPQHVRDNQSNEVPT